MKDHSQVLSIHAFDEDNAAWASWQRAIREEADGLVERYWSAILAVADGLESTPVEPVEVVNQETGEARMADSHRLLAGQVSELVIRTEADIR